MHTPIKSSGTKLTVSHHWHFAKSDGFQTRQEHSAASVYWSSAAVTQIHKKRTLHCTRRFRSFSGTNSDRDHFLCPVQYSNPAGRCYLHIRFMGCTCESTESIYIYINKWTMAHSKMVPKFWYLCTIFTMWISSNYFDIYTTWVICIYTIQQLVEETNHTKNIPHLCTSSNINWFEIRLTGLYEIKGIKRAVTSLVWITTKTPCKSLSY